MSKGLEALRDLENHFKTSSWAKETDFTMICFEIEKELEDFEWLKEHIGFQLLDLLSTSDKIKLLEIMGVEYKQGDWHIKL